MRNRTLLSVTFACLLALSLIFLTSGAWAQTSSKQAKALIAQWADENAEHVSSMSRKLWEWKEMGLKEFKSSDMLVEELEKGGFKVERGQAGMPTAFVGTFAQGTGKPVIGILAEFDALPNGHSCGHNLFGAGSIATALATKKAMESNGINGTLKVFGTPTEDTHGGKVWMARERVFDGCHVFLDWHPGTKNQAKENSNLAVQILEVNYYGKSAHAGRSPEQGRSALDGLMITCSALEFLREHMTEPMRIQYVISNGGQAPNIVPDYAQLKLAFRGPFMKDIEVLRSREGGTDDCMRAGALGSGTDVKVQVVGAFYNRLPNTAGAALIYENMKAIKPPIFTPDEKTFVQGLGKKHNMPLEEIDTRVHEPDRETAKASADTGDVSYIAPLLTMETTCAAVNSPGHHQANAEQYGMSIGYKGTVYAVKVLGATAVDLLTDKAKLDAVTKEFGERIKGKEYKAVIPPDLWPPIPDKNPPDFKGPAAQVRPKPQMPESMLYWKKK